jgi:D-alanyl-D-alanine endopeptidase (penicillin-binding protein 7)
VVYSKEFSMKYLILALALIATPADSRQVSTLVYNQTKGTVVVGDNLNVTRPIASITKLMTAMVTLDYDSDLQRQIRMPGSNKIPGGIYTREELLTAMLVRSDNGAADAIANDYPGGRKAFIRAMNKKAESIGMVYTKFADPTGLSAHNLSNAGSVGVMLKAAIEYPFIKSSSVQKQIAIQNKRYSIVLDNTNKMLLYDFDEILLSKTGFTNASGWSVALILEKDDQRFSVVVLGANSKDERYAMTKKLINQYFQELALEKEEEIQYNNDTRSIYQQIKDWFTK